MSEEKDELMNHEYDGIQEFNNPLPMWWLWTFFITIIFAFIYYIHYEVAGGPTLAEDLDEAMTVITAHQKANKPKSDLTEAEVNAIVAKADLAAGDKEFQSKCAACHGASLEGGIGPNLTDEYWLHGQGTSMDIVKVIKTGVLEKGMPPWEASMNQDQIITVAAYILSKKDSHPAHAKAPQGEKVK